VNHWKLDESRGVTANDSTGTQRGVLRNMAESSWINGRTGKALSFDGLDDYIEATGYKGITGSASRTCCAWIKTATTQQGSILSWGGEQNGQKWIFRIESNGTLALGVGGGYVCTAVAVNDGLWHHVAAVLKDDGSPSVNEIQLYVDGVVQPALASSTQFISTAAGYDVMIGAFQLAGITTGYFNGLIDDICIYNQAIEINEIFPENEYPVSTDGLTACWQMDETEGAIVHDSAASYDGALNCSGWILVQAGLTAMWQTGLFPLMGQNIQS